MRPPTNGYLFFKHPPQKTTDESPQLLTLTKPTTEALPVFTPSSSSELDKELRVFRETLVIPKHLSRYDRNRVFREKYHLKLRLYPVTMMISEEPVTLRPIVGGTKWYGRRDVIRVLNRMVTPEDLDNLPPFLLGLRQIKCGLSEGQKQKIARTCSLKGRIDVLMTIARDPKWYGFLFTRQAAREFMRGLLVEQSIPGKRNATMGALKHADELMAVFANTGVKVDPKMRLKRDPVIIGTALSLFADTSITYGQGVDVKGRTLDLCVFLKDECWKDVEWDQWTPETLPDGHKARVAVHKIKEAVLDYTPVLEGLLGAKELLKGSEVDAWLESESEKLAGKLAKWGDFVKQNIGVLRGGEAVRRMSLDLYRETGKEIYAKEKAARSALLQARKLKVQGKGEQGPQKELEEGELTQAEREELEALEKGM